MQRPSGTVVCFALASLAFIITVTAVVTQAAPAAFNAPVRGRGLLPFTTTIVLISSQADRLVVALSAVALVLLLVRGRQGDREERRWVFLISGMMTLCLFLWVLFGDVFLAFLPVIGGTAIVYSIRKSQDLLGESPSSSLLSIMGPCTLVAAALGISAFSRWLVNAADGGTPFSDWTWGASLLQLKMSALLYPVLPRLVLFFLAGWAVRIILSTVWADVLGAYSRVMGTFSVGLDGEKLVIGTKSTMVALVICVGLAALVGVYIYAPAINPSSALVGVDVKQFYYGAAQTMFGSSPAGALEYALSNDRTAYLLFQYGISEAAGSPDLAIRVMPALLSVLLVVSTFWFTRVATGDDLLSSTAALFASTSFQVTAGIDGGLYANWLAMVETFSFFGALLLGLRGKSFRNLATSAGFSVLLLFTHPWTWFAVMGIVVIYVVSLVITSRLGRDVGHLRDELIFMGGVLLINLGAEALKRFLPTGTGVEAVYGYTLSGLSPSNILLVVGALESTLTSYLAGALANPGIVVLGIVGVLTLKDLHSSSSRLLLCWVAAASGGAILTGDSAEFLQSRLLYIIPFQVFAAIGFVMILRLIVAAMFGARGSSLNGSRAFAMMAYLALASALACYALQTVGYLYQ